MDVLGAILLFIGATFLCLGGLGLVRMPDLFNRIQAGTKATTLGTLLTLAGVVCLRPDWGAKTLVIGLFVLFTNPLSAQVLARAVHRIGSEKAPHLRVDRLAEDTGEQDIGESDTEEAQA